LMGHARGAILLACAARKIPVWDLPATMVKRSLTGNGRASKLQVQRAIASICNLTNLPFPADVSDALAIALCASKRLENPLQNTKNHKRQ
ncbi:crossover junction endodeoxyribonuclease RuvC, partial [candidate division KSB1 bacterium]